MIGVFEKKNNGELICIEKGFQHKIYAERYIQKICMNDEKFIIGIIF